MRLIIITGMGGAGVSTVATRTAQLSATTGRRVALFDLSGGPPPPAAEFAARRVDAASELAALPALSAWLFSPDTQIGSLALGRLAALALPAFADVLALGAVEGAISTGRFDVVVVDAPPLGAAHRLLALPALVTRLSDAVPGYTGGRLTRSLARYLFDSPLPAAEALEELNDRLARLVRLAALLEDAAMTGVRVVVRPGAEVRPALAPLAMSGLPLEGVYAGVAQALASEERDRLAVAVRPLPLRCALPQTADDLDLPRPPPLRARVERADEAVRLVVPLPFQTRDALALRQQGDLVVISSGGVERTITLPSSLGGQLCTGAAYDGAELTLTFGAARAAR